jgi:hypothetical protein
MPDDPDDTSIPIITDEFYRRFLAGKESHPGRQDFANQFLQISAETNRRLQPQQAEVLKAQNVLIESQNVLIESQNVLIKSQDAVAKSPRFATWVLAFATIVLAGATVWSVAKPLTPVATAPVAPKRPAKVGS